MVEQITRSKKDEMRSVRAELIGDFMKRCFVCDYSNKHSVISEIERITGVLTSVVIRRLIRSASPIELATYVKDGFEMVGAMIIDSSTMSNRDMIECLSIVEKATAGLIEDLGFNLNDML